jgi:hypothetical protein
MEEFIVLKRDPEPATFAADQQSLVRHDRPDAVQRALGFPVDYLVRLLLDGREPQKRSPGAN